MGCTSHARLRSCTCPPTANTRASHAAAMPRTALVTNRRPCSMPFTLYLCPLPLRCCVLPAGAPRSLRCCVLNFWCCRDALLCPSLHVAHLLRLPAVMPDASLTSFLSDRLRSCLPRTWAHCPPALQVPSRRTGPAPAPRSPPPTAPWPWTTWRPAASPSPTRPTPGPPSSLRTRARAPNKKTLGKDSKAALAKLPTDEGPDTLEEQAVAIGVAWPTLYKLVQAGAFGCAIEQLLAALAAEDPKAAVGNLFNKEYSAFSTPALSAAAPTPPMALSALSAAAPTPLTALLALSAAAPTPPTALSALPAAAPAPPVTFALAATPALSAAAPTPTERYPNRTLPRHLPQQNGECCQLVARFPSALIGCQCIAEPGWQACVELIAADKLAGRYRPVLVLTDMRKACRHMCWLHGAQICKSQELSLPHAACVMKAVLRQPKIGSEEAVARGAVASGSQPKPDLLSAVLNCRRLPRQGPATRAQAVGEGISEDGSTASLLSLTGMMSRTCTCAL